MSNEIDIQYLKVNNGTLRFMYFGELKSRWKFWQWWFREPYKYLSIDVLTLYENPPPPDYPKSLVNNYVKPWIEKEQLDRVIVRFYVRNSKGKYFEIPPITVFDKTRKW